MEVDDARKARSENGFLKKLKGIKNLQIIVVIFIIAVALIIYSTVMTSKSGSEAKSAVNVMTSDELRLSSILGNIDGAGKVETMITTQNDVIVGVLVIAEGADSINVRLRLIDAASTALGVSKSIVNVYSRK